MANCMTLEAIVIAPTAMSPPYFSSDELNESTSRLSVDCNDEGAKPSARQGASTARERRTFARRSLSTARSPQRKRSAHTALIACDMTVAHAAPRTAHAKMNIKIGSSSMFVTAPMTTVIMLILEKALRRYKDVHAERQLHEYRPRGVNFL